MKNAPSRDDFSGLRGGCGSAMKELSDMKIPRLTVTLCCLGAVLAAGCGGSRSPDTAAAVPAELTVEILSLPRNCVVEMGGEYMGATPLKVSVPATPDGRWRGGGDVVHAISVSTPDNRFVETKKWRGGDPIPRRLLFRPPYVKQ
jgi:hypothetical protein